MFAALFFMYLGLREKNARVAASRVAAASLAALDQYRVIALPSVALSEPRAADRRQSALWMSGTFALGMLFVALQCVLWWSTWQQGITTSTGVLGTVMYSLTFLHAFHVVAGLLVLGYLFVITLRASASRGG